MVYGLSFRSLGSGFSPWERDRTIGCLPLPYPDGNALDACASGRTRRENSPYVVCQTDQKLREGF